MARGAFAAGVVFAVATATLSPSSSVPCLVGAYSRRVLLQWKGTAGVAEPNVAGRKLSACVPLTPLLPEEVPDKVMPRVPGGAMCRCFRQRIDRSMMLGVVLMCGCFDCGCTEAKE